jgi:hypothetical protein
MEEKGSDLFSAAALTENKSDPFSSILMRVCAMSAKEFPLYPHTTGKINLTPLS